MSLKDVKRQLKQYDTATVYREDYKAFLKEYTQGKNVYVDGYGVISADEALSVISHLVYVDVFFTGTYLTIIPPSQD